MNSDRYLLIDGIIKGGVENQASHLGGNEYEPGLKVMWVCVTFYDRQKESRREESSNEEKYMIKSNVVGERLRQLLKSTLTIGSPFLIQPLKSRHKTIICYSEKNTQERK